VLLAIDTSTTVVTLAIGRGARPLATRSISTDRRHAEVLAPAIHDVATEAGIELRELSAIVAGLGPGLFTGLRVGVTTAKAIAQALGVATVGIPTLDVVAASAAAPGVGDRVVGVLDARRGEVFWARYEGGAREGDDRVGPPEELRAELVAPLTIAGDGAARYSRDLAGPGVTLSDVTAPDPARLLELGAAAWARGDACDAGALVPRYVRRTDAEIAWDPSRFGTSRTPTGFDVAPVTEDS